MPRSTASSPGRVLIVGPVTWDVAGDLRIPGGTVSYAARTAAALGVHAHVLTSAGPDADLSAFEGHELSVVHSPTTLTFAHGRSDGTRTLRVLQPIGVTLHPRDLPATWPPPDVIILAPLIPGDVDVRAWIELPATDVCVTAQGLLRDESGSIDSAGGESAVISLVRSGSDVISVFLSDEDVAGWSGQGVGALVRQVKRVVITRGARGADIVTRSGTMHVPAGQATPLDTTGAGDVFAAAFILTVGQGEAEAARLASAYAAAAVELRGPRPLPPREAIEQRLHIG